jgi:hypothetical protein
MAAKRVRGDASCAGWYAGRMKRGSWRHAAAGLASLGLVYSSGACTSDDAAAPETGAGASAGLNGGGGAGAAQGGGGATPQGGAAGTGGSAGSAGSWRPFSDTSPWNTPIATDAAVDPDSAALIVDWSTVPGQTSFWINITAYSMPVYWVDSTSTPMVTVAAAVGGTGFRDGAINQWDAAGSGQAPIPAGAVPAEGTDRHLAVVDRAARMEWGLWNADSGSGSWTAGQASTMDLAGDGIRPSTLLDPWWAGAGPRACGFALIAGLITVAEIQAGSIDHALVVAYPHIRSRYFRSPASSAQGTTTEALPNRGIPCGGRLQLDPTLDVATLGLSPAGLAIARALQQYGAFVGDFSGAMSLYADAQAIPLDRFRLLELGALSDNGN